MSSKERTSDIINELESLFSGILPELTRGPMYLEEQEQQRISDIIIDLESLSLRTSTLTRELKRLQRKGQPRRSSEVNG
jgi:hypothetical protein